DLLGHFNGPSHQTYRDAISVAMNSLRALRDDGFLVLATSDHGGRDTPVGLSSSGVRAGLPAVMDVILSGDHYVGYAPSAAPSVDTFWWDGSQSRPVTAMAATIAASFSAAQAPRWLLLPTADAHFG